MRALGRSAGRNENFHYSVTKSPIYPLFIHTVYFPGEYWPGKTLSSNCWNTLPQLKFGLIKLYTSAKIEYCSFGGLTSSRNCLHTLGRDLNKSNATPVGSRPLGSTGLL